MQRYIIEVYVSKKLAVRCLKRYSEFEALHEVVRMNFKNIDLGTEDFPSKFQVINREETRRQYFERLLNRIVQTYCEKVTNETNRRLLSTIYVFMAGEQARPARASPLSDGSTYNGEENVRKSSFNSEEGRGAREQEFKTSHRVAEMSLPTPSPAKSGGKAGQEGDEVQFRAFMGTEFLVRFEDESEWK
jgi:hypothetical protein